MLRQERKIKTPKPEGSGALSHYKVYGVQKTMFPTQYQPEASR